MSELDALSPVPATIRLSTGTVLELESLRARQFFKLLRIITRGAMPAMQDLSVFKLDPEADAGAFAGRLLSLMLLSIPEAENEAIEFIQSMVQPAGLIDRRSSGTKLNKQDLERNTELWAKALTDLDNPNLDDLVTIIEAIVKREAGDIQALGKRLTAMFKLAEKTGQIPTPSPNQTSPAGTSSADSPERTTYSVTSTGGPTTSSVNSHSDGFVSVSLPSENVSTSFGGNETNG